MASNFKISRHGNGDSLHLRLEGDFDGMSAHELLKAINGRAGKARRVFVHTDRLRSVLPFGGSTFRARAAGSGADLKRLVFTGRFAGDLSVGGGASVRS
jgi:hypothetical protein